MKQGLLALLCASVLTTIGFNSARAEQNISFQPVPIIVGMVNGTFEFDLGNGWALGPGAMLWALSIGDVSISGFGLQARGNYYFAGEAFQQGAYMGASLGYASFKIEDTDSFNSYGDLEGEFSGIGATVLGGYIWRWSSFNMRVGGGIALSGESKIELKDSAGVVREDYSSPVAGFALEFGLGWAI